MVNKVSYYVCKQQHEDLIGEKSHGRKILLAYNSQNGWGIKKLNIFQLFLRDVFGLYKSTHSKTIYRAWKREIGQTQAIDNTIARICQKHLLKNRLVEQYLGPVNVNIQKHSVTVGNSDVSGADVICFAENHTDQEFYEKIIKMINRHAHKGDIVLYEGDEVPDLAPTLLKKGIGVKNWESNAKAFLYSLPSFIENEKKFKAILKIYEELFPKDSYTQLDGKAFKNKLDVFRQEIVKLGKSLNVPSEMIQKSMKVLEVLSNLISQGKNNNDISKLLSIIAIRALAPLENYLLMPESYCTDEERKIIYESIYSRNREMIAIIEQCRKERKRVFVIGGAAHFLRMPETQSRDYTKEIGEALQKHRYAIITPPYMFKHSLNSLSYYLAANS